MGPHGIQQLEGFFIIESSRQCGQFFQRSSSSPVVDELEHLQISGVQVRLFAVYQRNVVDGSEEFVGQRK